jgi:MFS family permease
VYALGATSLLNDAASEMIYPLMPLFLTVTIGAGAATLGLIEGTADALSSVLKLVSGHVSDRVGRRKPLVLAGYVLASLARPLVAFARTPAFVLGVRLADRVGKGLRSSPRDALIADVTPPALHGRAFGVHEAMDHAGAVVGPLIAYALLAGGLELRSVFLLSAVPALAACLVVALVVHEPVRPVATGGAPAGAPPLPMETATSRATATEVEAAPALPLPPAPARVLTGPFVGYVAAISLFALGNSSDAFLLLRAHDAGLPAHAAPLLWALHHVVKSAMGAWAGGLADRIGRRRALALGWVVYAAIYAGFAIATSRAAIVGLFVAYGLYFALVGGAQKALVAEIVPAAARARGFGIYHLFVGLAALPASVLFGVLYQRWGAPAAFLTGAALALAATALLPLSRLRALGR